MKMLNIKSYAVNIFIVTHLVQIHCVLHRFRTHNQLIFGLWLYVATFIINYGLGYFVALEYIIKLSIIS